MNWRETIQLIKDDLAFYSHLNSDRKLLVLILFNIQFQTLALYRVLRFLRGRRSFGLTFLLLYLQRILSGCYISPAAKIGMKCHFPHPIGIVIGQNVEIRSNAKIYQHVTLGSHGKPGLEVGYPIIEDDVVIYANAVIVGSVRIGRGSIVGTGSIVLNDVPNNTVVAGAPARALRSLSVVKETEYVS